jgi:D-alanyl-D-alanine endopeptidase (penicillin-binding protein 7)
MAPRPMAHRMLFCPGRACAARVTSGVAAALVLVLALTPVASMAVQEETIDLAAVRDAESPVGALPAARAIAVAYQPGQMPAIKSEYALVVDQDTNEILMQKNSDEIASIASITKLMTAMVTLDAGLPLDEELRVERQDRTIVGWAGSSLRPGTRLTRSQALHLALMSSENHAALLLGRTYPGGLDALVNAMNAKAHLLGMNDTSFVEPTGLSPLNRASPSDLVRLVKAAFAYPEIREYSVATEFELPIGKHLLHFHSTNRLTSHADWQIGLQKTGTLSAAGQCLVMQTVIEGRRVVMVLLDAIGRHSRFADAQRIHDWLSARGPVAAAVVLN